MADAWIKMRVTLRRSPQVVRLASAFNADACPLSVRILSALGALQVTWSLFDTHAIDGALSGYSLEAIDLEVGVTGWGQAMVDVGWLDVSAGAVVVYEWEKHNGTSSKRRSQEAERKRDGRKRCRQTSASDADAERPPSSSSSSSSSSSLSLSLSEGEPEREPEARPRRPGPVDRVVDRELTAVPDGIQADLDRWVTARREIAKPLGASSVRALLAEARKDPAAFRRRVDASITAGTTVLLEDRPTKANGVYHADAESRRAAKAATEFPEPDLDAQFAACWRNVEPQP